MIDIFNMTKSYTMNGEKKIVFSNFNFSVCEHDFVAIKGKSGCGKSTLLRIIGCLDKYDSGSYHFLNKNVSKLNDRQLSNLRNKEIGFVFQNFNLVPEYTVLENIEMPLGYAGISPKERKRRVWEMLEKFELSDKTDCYPNQLSGGQQQRISIARALINNPRIILADEPTGNLDEENTMVVMRLFSELYQNGVSLIVVTHDDLTASYAARTIVLN